MNNVWIRRSAIALGVLLLLLVAAAAVLILSLIHISEPTRH